MAKRRKVGDLKPGQFQFVAQMSHWLGGATAVWGSIALFGPWTKWYAVGILFCYTLIKEFWWDRRKFSKSQPRHQPYLQGFRDVFFYSVGSVGAALLHSLMHR